jgi:hypothetical protein
LEAGGFPDPNPEDLRWLQVERVRALSGKVGDKPEEEMASRKSKAKRHANKAESGLELEK